MRIQGGANQCNIKWQTSLSSRSLSSLIVLILVVVLMAVNPGKSASVPITTIQYAKDNDRATARLPIITCLVMSWFDFWNQSFHNENKIIIASEIGSPYRQKQPMIRFGADMQKKQKVLYSNAYLRTYLGLRQFHMKQYSMWCHRHHCQGRMERELKGVIMRYR